MKTRRAKTLDCKPLPPRDRARDAAAADGFTPAQHAEIDRLIERRVRIEVARVLLGASRALFPPRQRGGCGG